MARSDHHQTSGVDYTEIEWMTFKETCAWLRISEHHLRNGQYPATQGGPAANGVAGLRGESAIPSSSQ